MASVNFVNFGEPGPPEKVLAEQHERAAAEAGAAARPGMNRRRAERGGRRAETIAAWWLRLKGWSILARRVRTPVGEVDLVARRGRTLAFVEVKARATAEQARLCLDPWRLRRVVAAAEALAPRFGRLGDVLRIDAVHVVPGRLPRHFTNISQG